MQPAKFILSKRIACDKQNKKKAKTMAQLKLSENVLAVIRKMATLKGNRFASLVYRAESGELARHTILIGFSYHNAVVKSLGDLKEMKFAANSLEAQAQAELIASFEKTLAAHEVGKQNADYTKKDVYDDVALDGELVSGIRYNTTDGSFKLFGLSVAKTILENGIFKEVKSKPLTIAKDKLRRSLAVGKFREYKIQNDSLAQAKINGETLEM